MHKGRGGGVSDMFGGGLSSRMGSSVVAQRTVNRRTVGCTVLWSLVIVLLNPLHKIDVYGDSRVVTGASAIRGSRVGAGPMGEAERGDPAPRLFVSYWCATGHETRPSF